jgi:hypothetical protein
MGRDGCNIPASLAIPCTRERSRKAGKALATAATDRTLIEAVAAEMSDGIECAVSFWMKQVEDALLDPRLTTLGRVHAIQEIVKRYNNVDQSGASHNGYAA